MTATQRRGRAALAPVIPRPAPRPTPRPAPLRVVPPGELSPQSRRRRRRLLVFGAAALVVAGLFGVVIEHAVLAQQQFRLAALQARAATMAADNEALQVQTAELQSPSRIVSEARSKLGMVPPSSITYLVPGQLGPRVRAQAAVAPTKPATAGSGAGGTPAAPTSHP